MKKTMANEIVDLVPLMVRQVKKNRSVKTEKIKFGNNKQQYILLTLPQDKKNLKSLLTVYIHGGGFRFGSAMDHRYIGQSHADQGYAHININYRKTPRSTYPEAVHDVFLGLQKGIKILQERGYSFDGLAIAGSSAGSYLASMVCFSEEFQKQYDVNQYPIKGLCSLSGLLNCNGLMNSYVKEKEFSPMKKWLYGKFMRDFFKTKKNASTKHLPKESSVSLLVFHSSQDPLVPKEDNLDFYTQYQADKMWHTVDHLLHCDTCVAPFLYDQKEKEVYFQWLKKIQEKSIT